MPAGCGRSAALQGGHATLTEDALKDKKQAITGEGVSFSGRASMSGRPGSRISSGRISGTRTRRSIEPVSAADAGEVKVDMDGASGRSSATPHLPSFQHNRTRAEKHNHNRAERKGSEESLDG